MQYITNDINATTKPEFKYIYWIVLPINVINYVVKLICDRNRVIIY